MGKAKRIKTKERPQLPKPPDICGMTTNSRSMVHVACVTPSERFMRALTAQGSFVVCCKMSTLRSFWNLVPFIHPNVGVASLVPRELGRVYYKAIVLLGHSNGEVKVKDQGAGRLGNLELIGTNGDAAAGAAEVLFEHEAFAPRP